VASISRRAGPCFPPKHRYLAFLGEAKRFSTSSVDQVASAIADFEASTGFKDFRQFRIEQAQSYERKLGGTGADGNGRGLAKATISSRLAALKAFLRKGSLRGCARDDLVLNHTMEPGMRPKA